MTPRSNKPLDQMSVEELCVEASSLRTDLERTSSRLGTVYDVLHTTLRRTKEANQEDTRAYITLANSGRRLVGMVTQSLRRAIAVDRAVITAKMNAEEAERRRVEKKAREEEKRRRYQVKQTREQADIDFRARLFGTDPVTTQDDLIELYGED